jgi:peptidoglycan-associated lipoprotein
MTRITIMKIPTPSPLARIAWIAALLIGLQACSSTPPDDVPLGSDEAGGVEVTPGSGGSTFGGSDLGGSDYQGGGYGGGGGGAGGGALGNPNDPNSPLYERIVYFEYDSSQLSPQYQAVVSNHARYLAATPSASISLEGHTDERGTREYNLALGERRAQAIGDLMMLDGASANQLQTLTYGEERAADMGTGEAAWAANRRVEIVYLSQ